VHALFLSFSFVPFLASAIRLSVFSVNRIADWRERNEVELGNAWKWTLLNCSTVTPNPPADINWHRQRRIRWVVGSSDWYRWNSTRVYSHPPGFRECTHIPRTGWIYIINGFVCGSSASIINIYLSNVATSMGHVAPASRERTEQEKRKEGDGQGTSQINGQRIYLVKKQIYAPAETERILCSTWAPLSKREG